MCESLASTTTTTRHFLATWQTIMATILRWWWVQALCRMTNSVVRGHRRNHYPPCLTNKNTELCCCCVNGMHEWDLLLRVSVWCCAYIDSAGTAREQAKTGRCQHTLFCNFLHSNYNKYTFNTAKCTTNWHKLKFWSTWGCAVYKLLCPN